MAIHKTSVVCSLLILIASVAQGGDAAKEAAPRKSSDLFKTTKVWNVHFSFTPQQWEAMEPKNEGNGRFGGGPGGRGPGGFGGPGMLVAPLIMQQADQNKDGKISAEEFRTLAQSWFSQWDKEQSGILKAEQLRAGVTSLFPAGGPGGRGPGAMLQGAPGKRNGLAAVAGFDFQYVHADMDFNGQVVKDVGVRFKGNNTWMQSRGTLKRSMKIELNHFTEGQKFAGLTKLNLHNNVVDASWMNEVLSHRLYRDAGVPAPRTAYARVYLTVPGKYDHQYLGLYSIVEDVDKHFAKENLGASEGAIFKPVTRDVFADLGDDWTKYKQMYDPKTKVTPQQTQRVIDFARLLARADDAEFAKKVGDFVDLDETARYFATTVWICTLDSILSMGQNYYVHLDARSNRFQFIPWDLDHSFGQFPMGGTQEQRENLSIHHPWRGDNRFLDRLFKVDTFKKTYLGYLEEFGEGIFKPKRIAKQVDEIALAIRPAVREESDVKLARFDKVVAGESVEPMRPGGGPGDDRSRLPDDAGPTPQVGGGPGGGGPGGGAPGGMRTGGMQPGKPIKPFVVARAKAVADQLSGKSEGEAQAGGGPGGPRGGPGGMGGGPGNFLAGAFTTAFDANKDGLLTREEFVHGFDNWFKSWNTDKSGMLTEEQLQAGINKDLAPMRGRGGQGNFGGFRGAPGGPDGGPPNPR